MKQICAVMPHLVPASDGPAAVSFSAGLHGLCGVWPSLCSLVDLSWPACLLLQIAAFDPDLGYRGNEAVSFYIANWQKQGALLGNSIPEGTYPAIWYREEYEKAWQNAFNRLCIPPLGGVPTCSACAKGTGRFPPRDGGCLGESPCELAPPPQGLANKFASVTSAASSIAWTTHSLGTRPYTSRTLPLIWSWRQPRE